MGYSGAGMAYPGGAMPGGYSGGGPYGYQDCYVNRSSSESPLPRSLDGYIDGSSTSSSYGTAGSRNGYADGDRTSSRRTASGSGGPDQREQTHNAR